MSNYPECKHGHSNPNIPCMKCEIEDTQAKDRAYMQQLRDEIAALIEGRRELKSERDKLQQERDDAKAQYEQIAKDYFATWEAQSQCRLQDNFDISLQELVRKQIAYERFDATQDLASLQKELEEVKAELDKAKVAAKGFAHSSESWELLHAKRHEELEQIKRDREYLFRQRDIAAAENARFSEALKDLLGATGVFRHWLKPSIHASSEYHNFADACDKASSLLSPQSPEPAAQVEERKCPHCVNGVLYPREDVTPFPCPFCHGASASPVTISTKGGDAGLGATPETKGESETPERKHLVASAGYWFDGARKYQRMEGRGADAVMCMENAYNHVENALYACQEARDKAGAELKVATAEFTTQNEALRKRIDTCIEYSDSFDEVKSQLKQAMEFIRRLSGQDADRLALDMDHRDKDHSRWYAAVEEARKFRALTEARKETR